MVTPLVAGRSSGVDRNVVHFRFFDEQFLKLLSLLLFSPLEERLYLGVAKHSLVLVLGVIK